MSTFNIDNVLIMDMEVYPNYVTIGLKNTSGEYVHVEFLDDLRIRWSRIKDNFFRGRTLVGFNNHGYDDLILAAIEENRTLEEIHTISKAIIESNANSFAIRRSFSLPDHRELGVDTIDVMQIIPGRIALKIAGARMHHRKLQELPYNPHMRLGYKQIQNTLTYCNNDLDITEKLWLKHRKQFELRQDMSDKYNVDLRSKGDAAIANIVLASEYCKGKNLTLRELSKKVDGSPDDFRFEPPKWISTEFDDLQAFFDKVSEINFELSEKGSVRFPPELSDEVVTVGDRSYQVGIGGLHSIDTNGMWKAGDGWKMVDLDVTSYYPAIILNAGLYPSHMGPEFLKIYKNIVNRRIAAKMAGRMTEAASLKITANGTFGQTSSPYSYLYDPKMMATVTLTGQLSLLMLIADMEYQGIHVVSANTDGITLLFPDEQEGMMQALAKDWERHTGFNLERADYSALVQRDVNTYLAIKTDGTVKSKGALSPHDDIMHNPSFLIVNQAIIEYLTNDTPLRETIENCDDLTRFVKLRRVTGGAKDENDKHVGSIVRWYYATGREDCALYYKNNDNLVPESDRCVPVMDLPEEFPSDVDFDRYVEMAQETLENVTTPKRYGRNLQAQEMRESGFSPVPADHKGTTVCGHDYDFSNVSAFATQTGLKAGLMAIRMGPPALELKKKAQGLADEMDKLLDAHPTLKLYGFHIYRHTEDGWPQSWNSIGKKFGCEVRFGQPVYFKASVAGTIEELPADMRDLMYRCLPAATRRRVDDRNPPAEDLF